MSTKKVGVCKGAVDYVAELKTVLDDLASLVERSAKRGFRPSFVVSYGTIRSVSTSPMTARKDPRGRKAAPEDEVIVEESELD